MKKSAGKGISAAKKGTQKVTKKEMEEEKIEEPKTKTPSKKVVSRGDFPPFDDFINQLYSWKKILSKYTSGKQFKFTYDYVKEEYATKTCYPPPELIFNAFKLTPLQELKVVIVGQDPYHQPGQAMGLCFSVPRTTPAPPSLKNMYKSLNSDPDIKNFKTPKHGDLTKWAEQGVFLLNDILTVVDSTPEAHKNSGWASFTNEVIKLINSECDKIVFLLWGKPAQKKASIVNETKHFVLKTSHPSPLGARYGFLTANHFGECNKILKSIGKKEIDWNLD